MSRSLLGIFTCHRYSYPPNDWVKRPIVDRVSALRDTWLQDVDIDYKLFYGRSSSREPKHDEIFLNAPDDYLTSAYKLKALVRWTLDHGYDRLLKVDDDIYVHWDRMVASKGFTQGDYVGGGVAPNEPNAWGGVYWLSKRAMEIVASSPNHPSEWAEDKWVGLALNRRANIHHDFESRYFYQRCDETSRLQYVADNVLVSPNNYISMHALRPETMRAYYQALKSSAEK